MNRLITVIIALALNFTSAKGQIAIDSLIELRYSNGFCYFKNVEDTLVQDFTTMSVNFISKLNDEDKLTLIGKLLSFEKNNNLSFMEPKMHSLKSDCYLFMGNINPIKFNITSLILINVVITGNFNLSPTYVLTKNSKDNLNETKINLVYRLYKKWYRKAKRKGINYMIENKIMPLTRSKIYWVGSECR